MTRTIATIFLVTILCVTAVNAAIVLVIKKPTAVTTFKTLDQTERKALRDESKALKEEMKDEVKALKKEVAERIAEITAEIEIKAATATIEPATVEKK